MIKVKNGVKYYPVSEYIIFNLDSLHCKVENELFDARDNNDWDKADRVQNTSDDIEDLLSKCQDTGYLCGKDYGKAKEYAVYRECLRDEACAIARQQKMEE